MLICFVTNDCVVVFGSEGQSKCGGCVLRLVFVLEGLQLETAFHVFALHLVPNHEIEFATVLRNYFHTERFHFAVVFDESAHFNRED